MTSNTKEDKEINCDLEHEFSPDDDTLLKNINLTDEQLKLKATNLDAFWKSVAETVRSDLSDLLDDNQELHRLKELLQEDNRDLIKENIKLIKLVNEAKEICNEYLE